MVGILKKIIPSKWKNFVRRKLARFLAEAFDEQMKYCETYIPYQKESDSFLVLKAANSGDGRVNTDLPIPPEPLCLAYADSREHFLLSGEQLVISMKEILEKGGYFAKTGDRILDFGCGAGRLIRWLADIVDSCEVWGTDVSTEAIIWCKNNLTPPFRFATTTTSPSLPFEDKYFDLIYAGSVFTHIDDLADAWFLELRRILKPEGMLYVTIHDQNSIKLLKGPLRDAHLAKSLRTHKKWLEYSGSNFTMFSIRRALQSQVFYDANELRRKLEYLLFDVIAVSEEAYECQTAFLLRKKSLK
jgi:ubiquinone/menaquinone biosynthesis C-methylase UbiE